MERKANWTEGQVELLIDLVTDEERWSVIRGKFGPTLTVQTKHNAWLEVAERINASSTCQRTVKDVKKKWQDLQSHTKKKEANRKSELKKTGGGPAPPELKCWERKIVSVLSNDVICGVEGGFDSLDSSGAVHSFQMSQSKRKYDEMDIEPEMVEEAPTSSGFCLSKEASKTSVSKDSQPQALGMCSSGDSAKRRRTVPVNNTSSENISLQQRIVQIEEEKLEVMRCNLQVEKRKLELMEQYVHWRMESRAECSTPSVSPVIRGLFTS